MRRLAALLVLALSAALLAGCSAIPMTGPVNTAPSQGAAAPESLVLTPARPTAGALPADVVKGFIYAGTGQQDDYAIARQYLTPAFAKRWNPDTGVVVSQGALHVTASGTSAAATVSEAAELSASGALTWSPPHTSPPLPFTLQRVNGEWRISSAPDGIVLPLDYFTRLFHTVPLDFFTPDYGELVPDLRWFPSHGDLLDHVVRRLLAGASAPIASPVTATSFARGTTLHRPVQLLGSTALVDLHFASGVPSVAALERMRRQLEATLVGQQGVTRVEVAVDGEPQSALRLAPLSASGTTPTEPLVKSGSKFGFLSASGGQIAPDKTLGAAIVKAEPTAVTVSSGLGRAAVLTRTGDVVLVTGSGKPAVLDSRGGLVAPTLDPEGWVWSVQGSSPSLLQAVKEGHAVKVPIALPVASVSSIEMSRDGTRVLMVLDDDSNPRVVVAGVQRSADGTPTGLTTAVYEGAPLTDETVIGATWVDSGSIAVLARSGSTGTESVSLQQLGGQATADGTLRDAKAIVGGDSQVDLSVLAAGEVQQTTGGSTVWQSVASNIDLIAVQR